MRSRWDELRDVLERAARNLETEAEMTPTGHSRYRAEGKAWAMRRAVELAERCERMLPEDHEDDEL